MMICTKEHERNNQLYPVIKEAKVKREFPVDFEEQLRNNTPTTATKNFKKNIYQKQIQGTKCRNDGKIRFFVVNTQTVPKKADIDRPQRITGYVVQS